MKLSPTVLVAIAAWNHRNRRARLQYYAMPIAHRRAKATPSLQRRNLPKNPAQRRTP